MSIVAKPVYSSRRVDWSPIAKPTSCRLPPRPFKDTSPWVNVSVMVDDCGTFNTILTFDEMVSCFSMGKVLKCTQGSKTVSPVLMHMVVLDNETAMEQGLVGEKLPPSATHFEKGGVTWVKTTTSSSLPDGWAQFVLTNDAAPTTRTEKEKAVASILCDFSVKEVKRNEGEKQFFLHSVFDDVRVCATRQEWDLVNTYGDAMMRVDGNESTRMLYSLLNRMSVDTLRTVCKKHRQCGYCAPTLWRCAFLCVPLVCKRISASEMESLNSRIYNHLRECDSKDAKDACPRCFQMITILENHTK